MKPFLTLQSVDAVLDCINGFEPLPAQTVPLDQACGRRLCQDFIAPADLPGFNRSTVDGYAVRARDTFGASEGAPALLQCVGACVMGEAAAFELKEGETARILTGAMLPKGADCVVMLEYSRPAGKEHIELLRSQAPGDNIVTASEDAAQGSLLIRAGKRLRPQEIGCLAAFGVTEPVVRNQPRIALISTGDEVIPVDQEPAPGQVRDVNSHSLGAIFRSSGASVRQIGLIRDNQAQLETAIREALADSDAIVVSGGSSAGSRDYTAAAFLGMPNAKLLAHGVAMRPGKPFILAETRGKPLIGLPGHVSGALVCGRVFILPLLRKLQGGCLHEPAPALTATLYRSIVSAQGRRDYIRCAISGREKDLLATPLLAPSAVISGLVEADGLIVCPENREGYAKGDKVEVELL